MMTTEDAWEKAESLSLTKRDYNAHEGILCGYDGNKFYSRYVCVDGVFSGSFQTFEEAFEDIEPILALGRKEELEKLRVQAERLEKVVGG